jgi:hypothetical protein
MKALRLLAPAIAAAIFAAGIAFADDPKDAGAGSAPPERITASCVERVPPGATRPRLEEAFPQRGFSGYAARLEITITHGKGETVIPEGFKLATGADATKALDEAGFKIPEPDGGAGPSIESTPGDASSVTKLSIPFVPLPKEGGRNAMVLPPVPIAVARANGEVMTLCTQPHGILIEDPIANELDPKVKPNPPGRPQREDWPLARQLAIGVAIGAVIGALAVYLLRRWLARPRVVIVLPPRLPWLVALDELDDLRSSKLLAEGKTDEYFDRVSDCVRKYLGARYGFDGLESTSDEMRGLLKRVRPQVPGLKKIHAFLGDCDLVKFARVTPAAEDCLDALRRGEEIVRATIPAAPRPRPSAAAMEASP